MSFAEVTPGPARTDPADRPIRVDVYEADNVTFVATLTSDITGSRSWTDEELASGLGSATVTVPLFVDSDDLTGIIPNPDIEHLTRGRVLRFHLNEVPLFAAIIRPRRQKSVSASGLEQALTRSLQCKGLLSEWDTAVLPPAPGSEFFPGGDTRHFGWMSKEAVIADLDDAVILRPVFQAGYEHPEPWVDGFGAIFDASNHRYFLFDLELDEEVSLSAHMAFGDQGIPWVNGVPMGQGALPPETSWPDTRHGGAKLGAGVHRWAVDVQGLPDAPEPKFTMTAFEVNDATTGTMNGDTILFRTGYVTGTTPYPWKASATAQGPTAKQVIRSVILQVQAEQGLLLDWNLYGDDDLVDANGNPLDQIPHLPMQVGVKLGAGFLRSLAAAWCDLAVSATGKTLFVYRWGERGDFYTGPATVPIFEHSQFGGVTDGRLQNIIELDHEERTS